MGIVVCAKNKRHGGFQMKREAQLGKPTNLYIFCDYWVN